MKTLDWWKGKGGDDYTKRNKNTGGKRVYMWRTILSHLPSKPSSILEVGSNIGLNLDVLYSLTQARMIGLEPNSAARDSSRFEVIDSEASSIPLPDKSVEMVFTCGVLIHIPPMDLRQACNEMHRVSSRYIICIEYFSHDPVEVHYRGQPGLLWKRDFGRFWLDHYNLGCLGYGFFWKPMTGLDDLTWWAFERRV